MPEEERLEAAGRAIAGKATGQLLSAAQPARDRPGEVVRDNLLPQAERRGVAQRLAVIPAHGDPDIMLGMRDQVGRAPVPPQGSQRPLIAQLHPPNVIPLTQGCLCISMNNP